jgi:phosphohistidine phosphatase
MKDLLLFRHAKAEQAGRGHDDFERGLTRRGHQAAARVTQWMVNQGLRPDLILCSASRRTRETLTPVHEAFAPGVRVQIDPGLYLADAPALAQAVRSAPAECKMVLVIAHNPGLHELASELARHATPGALDGRERLIAKMVTAGLAHIRLPLSAWSKFDPHAPGKVRLLSYVTPTDLDDR